MVRVVPIGGVPVGVMMTIAAQHHTGVVIKEFLQDKVFFKSVINIFQSVSGFYYFFIHPFNDCSIRKTTLLTQQTQITYRAKGACHPLATNVVVLGVFADRYAAYFLHTDPFG